MRISGTAVSARRRHVVIVAGERVAAKLHTSIAATGAAVSVSLRAGADLPADGPCDLVVLSTGADAQSDWRATCARLAVNAVPVLLVANDPAELSPRDACATGVDHVLVMPVSNGQMATSIEVALARAESRSARSGIHPVDVAPMASDGLELSTREREVLTLLSQGHRAHDIGRVLFISHHTARNHIKTVFRKLGVHSHVELLQRLKRGAGP